VTAIRQARASDASTLAELTTQLSYPVAQEELARRLEPILLDQSAAVLVAVDDSDTPVGWIHVFIKQLLERSGSVLIGGLVVDERHRSRGIGQQLLQAGEAWAREQGMASMTLYSRQARTRAHRFYERHGYRISKESYFFEKDLAPESSNRPEGRIGLYSAVRPDGVLSEPSRPPDRSRAAARDD
jgi:GNAT superfamily N-acetyltransferase